MKRRPIPCAAARARPRGFTLVELMVGMAVGLLVTLAIAGVMVNAENQRRTTTMGSDAQINGGMAIYAMERELKMAGYGLMTYSSVVGCTLQAKYGGADLTTLPAVLAPVLITAGANGAPDSVRVLSSSKSPGFAMPLPAISPYYDPSISPANGNNATRVPVSFNLGVATGDLLAMFYGPSGPCQIFQATVDAADDNAIYRPDSGTWNASKYPTQAADKNTVLVNLGTLRDFTFSITADQRLQKTISNLAAQTSSSQNLQSNIVTLKALYGKDTNADDVVDTYDTQTPIDNAGWKQVRAVRIAVLARSAQYEKDEVTTAVPKWDVGNASSVSGSAVCGDSHCIPLMNGSGSDWKHYRYKIFDLVVPLRNQVWAADFVVAPAPSAPASGQL